MDASTTHKLRLERERDIEQVKWIAASHTPATVERRVRVIIEPIKWNASPHTSYKGEEGRES